MANAPLRIDMHVHMVGNGANGSGGWLRLSGWHRLLAGFMLRTLHLSPGALNEDLDALYVNYLLAQIRDSSFDAVVLLAHERVYNADGVLRDDLGSMFVPNDVVLDLARKHPEFLAGVSIHPARRDALPELERCIQGGAVLMKCLPNCQNIDLSDRRHIPFWEKMAAAKLPLLAHTGGEHTVPVVNSAYADPKRLRLPLECGVTVIAAHCGTKSGALDPDYFEDWRKMLREFPNLYGDLSALVSLNRCGHLRECTAAEFAGRVLHGSDFPVPILGHRMWMQGWIDWPTFRKCQALENPLERDWAFKKALGFSDEIRTQVASLLRHENGAPPAV
jgi:hypothetical protein